MDRTAEWALPHMSLFLEFGIQEFHTVCWTTTFTADEEPWKKWKIKAIMQFRIEGYPLTYHCSWGRWTSACGNRDRITPRSRPGWTWGDLKGQKDTCKDHTWEPACLAPTEGWFSWSSHPRIPSSGMCIFVDYLPYDWPLQNTGRKWPSAVAETGPFRMHNKESQVTGWGFPDSAS